MGVDSYAIFDITLTESELVEISEKMNIINPLLKDIYGPNSLSFKWEIDIDLYENEKTIEIFSESCDFGLFSNGKLLNLWNTDRWKWLINHQGNYLRNHFEICKVIANFVKAKRVIHLSDYVAEDFGDESNFNKILSSLGTPYDPELKYEIVKGYHKIFFYQEY